ncbi:MAG: PQQ-binding-like beta-propeller repeat protein [bacterium]|nr:PQQ-binding-like beta-propeller repeat protein [bacterium]
MKNFLFLILFTTNLFVLNAQENKYVNWSFKTKGKLLSHPVSDGSILYFGSNDKTFYALDTNTKKTVWTFNTNSSIQSKALINKHIVYFKSGNIVYALDKNSGNEIWNFKNKSEIVAKQVDNWDYHHGAPVIYNSIIYFGFINGKIVGLDSESGKVKSEFITIDSASVKSGLTVRNNVLYFGDWNGKIYAYDLKTKKKLWAYKTYEKQQYSTFGQINTQLSLSNKYIAFGARNPEFQVLDIKSGKKVWSYTDKNGGWISGDPLIVNDTVYVTGSDNHKIIAFNLSTGKIYWEYEFLFNSFSKPILYKNYILLTTGDAYSNYGSSKGLGYLYALDRKTGKIKNFSLVGGNLYTTPVLLKNTLYLPSEDNNLYAVDLQTFLNDNSDLNDKGYKSVEIIETKPNPFVNDVDLKYKVNYKTKVSVKLTDLNGKEIRSLVDEEKPKGEYTIKWDCKNNSGIKVAAGYYTLEIGSGEYFKNTIIQKK